MSDMTSTPQKGLDETPAGFRGLGIEWPRFASWQWKILVVLTLINLLNYFDRLIVFSMFPLLQDEFDLSDFQLGFLASVFIVIHSLAVLPFGFWSDRGPRQKIMSFGVFLWSAATMLSGVATNFLTLLGARSLVGVGEGAYAPAGTAMISYSFPHFFRCPRAGRVQHGHVAVVASGAPQRGGLLSQWVGWRLRVFSRRSAPASSSPSRPTTCTVPVALPSEKPPSIGEPARGSCVLDGVGRRNVRGFLQHRLYHPGAQRLPFATTA